MAKRYTLSVHDMSRKKLCELYDSTIISEGEPYDVEHVDPIDGLKSITFTLPRTVNGKDNWRAAYMTNDYQLRWGEDGKFDWFVIDEPEDAHTGRKDVIAVSASHIASLLNRKNLYGSFDDTNGIDTCGNLVAKALTGTGWTLGECDTFYEADGTTEKIRSYTCNEKTGAYSMIAGICDLFVAYPTFNGDEKTVDIHALANHDGMMEVVFGKNLDSIQRTRTSTELITRLYVEGDYTQNQYVGIDDVNPTGLPFILNFDYYRETGQFTAEHETALNDYLAAMSSAQAAIKTAAEAEQAALTQLATIWGSSDFVLYSVSGGAPTYVMKSLGATDENAELAEGDKLAAVQSNGTYSYVTLPASKKLATNIAWAVKFLGPVAGTMGAREVSVEAKTTTLDTLTKAIAAADTQTERDQLTSEKTAQQASINTLNTERYAQMLQCIALAQSIGGYMSTIAAQQALQEQAELAFDAAMGDMLKDGAWNDKNYVAGQEESLYADALVVAAEMSRPQYEYSLSVLDLSTLTGHKGEEFKKNQKIRVYDEATGINDIAYVSEKRTKPRLENRNSITLSTDETGVALKSFDTLINRIMTQADLVKENQGIYERARALSGDGTLAAARLDGEIDLLKNKMASTASGIYTDDSGNMIIEAADGSSAMMLTGAGFMLAAGKDNDGNWEWRTFGTGNGFTADMITTGILKAGIITILGSDQFYWDANNIYIFEPGTNGQHQIRIGQYDGTNYGIGFTRDGGQTWQNAISFNGVTLSASDQQTLTQLSADVSGLQTSVSNVESDVSTLEQTAESLTARVAGAEGDISALEQTASGLATRVTDAEGDISALEQTASSLVATVGDANSGLVAQVAAIPGEITAAVGNIEIGGTNLIKDTAWLSLVGSMWTFDNAGAFIKYPASSGNSEVQTNFGGCGFVHWNQPSAQGLMWATQSEIYVKESEEYTVSFRYRGSGLWIGLAAYNSGGTQTTTLWDSYTSASTQDFSKTYTVPSGIVRLRFVLRVSASTAGVLGRIKVERGNKATAWSPAPTDPVIVYGSTINLTEERILLQAPAVYINVSGGNGDMTIDETGVTAAEMFANNVTPRYDGPSTITVNPSASSTSASVVRTLGEAFNLVSNKYIPYTVNITVGGNTYESGDVILSGCDGENIDIYLNAHTINGRIVFETCSCRLGIQSGTVSKSSTADRIHVDRCIGAYVGNIKFVGSTTDNGVGVQGYYSNVFVENCQFNGVNVAVDAQTLSRFYVSNSTGAVKTLYRMRGGGHIYTYGTVPTYTTATDYSPTNGSGLITGTIPSGSGGGSTPPTPTTTSTLTLNCTSSSSLTGGNWQSPAKLYSGINGGSVRNYGVFWFNNTTLVNTLSGKTIQSAKLTVKRLTGEGRGGSSTVRVGVTTTASASGTLTPRSDIGMAGSAAASPGETVEVPISTAAIQAFLSSSNTAKGFFFYDSASSTWSGQSFSYDYMALAGYGASGAPVLTVVYTG